MTMIHRSSGFHDSNTVGRNASRLGSSFESHSAAVAEDQKRAILIEKTLATTSEGEFPRYRIDSILARTLAVVFASDVHRREPYETLASSLHMRSVRATVITALLEATESFEQSDLSCLTVINRHWRFTIKQLSTVTAASIKRQFRTHLERAGILEPPGFFFAFLHGEYEPTAGRFQLHFHILTTAEKAEALLEGLSGRWGYDSTPSRAPAIRRNKLEDRPRQLSYLVKSFWPERAIIEIDGKIRRVRGVRRIKCIAHTAYLCWLHRQELSDLMLLNNCMFRGSKFHGIDSCIFRNARTA